MNGETELSKLSALADLRVHLALPSSLLPTRSRKLQHTFDCAVLRFRLCSSAESSQQAIEELVRYQPASLRYITRC